MQPACLAQVMYLNGVEQPLAGTSAMLNHHRGGRMIDDIAITSYRVDLAASQFSVAQGATCYAN